MSGVTGILCAVAQEIRPFLDNIRLVSTIEKGSLKFLRGFLGEAEIVLVRSGMGKVNAACAAQCMIDSFSIDRIIISGVGGSWIRIYDFLTWLSVKDAPTTTFLWTSLQPTIHIWTRRGSLRIKHLFIYQWQLISAFGRE